MLVLENGKYIVKNEGDSSVVLNIETSYEEKVVSLIRESYSVDEELALQRQRNTKPEEFQAYFEYCEECKKRAKAL